jgi:16S rRNA (cytidine1402-2'-O)-methyltransferase
MPGILYLVSTPIGNLKDITLRAIEILETCDLIACEDTRRTGKLLKELGIKTRMISYHEHNESERAIELVELLSSGNNIAIVSDAGSPGIADPGYRAVNKAINSGADVVSIPGPTAFVSALTVSGLPTDSIYFGGFLPSKKGSRTKRLRECDAIPATLVFYEAPHRLISSLKDCLDVLGDREAAVARELTKLHEETVRGNLSSLIRKFETAQVRGEIVLMIDRSTSADGWIRGENSLAARYNELVESGLDPKKALKQAAKERGLTRSEAYRRIQLEKDS